jgi:hypothetical protein
MKRIILVLGVFLGLCLSGCNLPKSAAEKPLATTPTGPAAAETARPGPTKVPATETARPTPTSQPATETAPPTSTKPPATRTPAAQSSLPIVYYYFVAVESHTFPAGSVVILPDILVLGPTLSDKARSPDPATNIRSALQAMIHDPRNAWTSENLNIANLTFKEGAADVALQGEYFGAGDVVLIAARMQILLTVFAEASVQTAVITINEKNIANMGISHSSEARPARYAYTRSEIETFMAENAYN